MEKEKEINSFFNKHKVDIVIAIYGLIYIMCFFLLEWNTKTYTVVQTAFDQMIPFCEYFVIPYLMWFAFIFITKTYFSNPKRSKKEYYRLLAVLGTGMTVFLIISFIFPNGHNLRPELTGSGLLVGLTRMIYFIDSSSNVLPSLHVYEAVACCTALLYNEEFRKKKGRRIGVVGLTALIIISTMFLKQHSVIDVVLGFVFYGICHEIFYRILPSTKHIWSKFIKKEEIISIPNILSGFRIILAILFLGIFNRYGIEQMYGVLIVILILSGITDFLDGRIARKYDMITEFGKLIDPIADKLTQGVVLWCFIGEYPMAKLLLVIFVIKESYMCIEGTRAVVLEGKNDGAKWYGKISTAIFYIVMVILVVFRDIPLSVANSLLSLSGVCMVLAFVLYAREYKKRINIMQTK